MRKKKIFLFVMAVMTVFVATAIFLPMLVRAGSLEPSGPPGPTTQIPPAWSQKLTESERFEYVLGGEAVLDKETGLVWAKNANLDGQKNWEDAISYCIRLIIGDRRGWRLPTIAELSSLVDQSQPGIPKIPPGFFDNVQTNFGYWSSTQAIHDAGACWYVYMYNGNADTYGSGIPLYVWPVRGSN